MKSPKIKLPVTFPLRDDHLFAIAEGRREAQAARIAAHMAQQLFGSANRVPFFSCLDDAHVCRALAEGFGIEEEADLLIFADFVLHYGPDFPAGAASDWAQPILTNKSLKGREKVRQLLGKEPL